MKAALTKVNSFLSANKSLIKDLFLFMFVGSLGLELKQKRKELQLLREKVAENTDEFQLPKSTGGVTMV